jgi:hypothetical protein
MIQMARILILIGVFSLVVGSLMYGFAKSGVPLGRLPGDIRIQNGNTTCIIALGTSILLSIVLTVILNLIVKFLNR